MFSIFSNSLFKSPSENDPGTPLDDMKTSNSKKIVRILILYKCKNFSPINTYMLVKNSVIINARFDVFGNVRKRDYFSSHAKKRGKVIDVLWPAYNYSTISPSCV